MADAERDRLDLNARIERLEMDKQELEAENALKIEENRELLDQLEALNNSVSESDTKIKSLEASLLSSQQAIRRLEASVIRAEDAERHLAMLEQEQADLQQELVFTKEDSRSHAQRFKEAQRGIIDMQDQLERMELEARQEQDRHAEIVTRMERQREVEKQLDTAAGRLKGAAATKSMNDQKTGPSVVNHFVRDLLQDNASLQLGIAELREMLLNSNDEIQSLREQLMYHQPMDEEISAVPTLEAELGPIETSKVSQELHIHHHYHVVSKPEPRKPRRKRLGLTPGTLTSPVLSSPGTPTSSGQWRLGSSPTAPAILSKQTPSAASAQRQRWSVISEQPSDFASSVPSSPRSNQRNSMFDPAFMIDDPPASPTTSYDPMSPTWRAHRKGPSDISALSFQAPSLQIDPPGSPATPQGSRLRRYEDHVIKEEDEDEDAISRLETPDFMGGTPSLDENSTIAESDVSRDDFMFRPRLHRAVSHESIISLSGGLDIHTLKARPSQLTLRPLGGVEAVVTGVTAQPTLSRGSARRSTAALRESFAGRNLRAVSGPMPRSLSPNPGESSQNSTGAIGKWVGWRPWGGSASTTAEDTTSKLPDKDKDKDKEKDKDKDKDWNRPTGINQAGAIPGFQKYWTAQRRKGAPAQVTPSIVDHSALAEGLLG